MLIIAEFCARQPESRHAEYSHTIFSVRMGVAHLRYAAPACFHHRPPFAFALPHHTTNDYVGKAWKGHGRFSSCGHDLGAF